MSETAPSAQGGIKTVSVAGVGLALGVVLFAVALAAPLPDLPPAGRATLAVVLLVATWWMTQALPIPATSLLPLVLLPLLSVAPAKAVAARYANDIVFLFLGGFLLALAIERCGLHRRLAFAVLRLAGSRLSRLTLGFMAAAALASAWISNTATALMLLPIGIAVVARVKDAIPEGDEAARAEVPRFSALVLLGIAYGCSLGGLATPIGTPPNGVLLGLVNQGDPTRDISFFEWMVAMAPLTVVFVGLAWLTLARIVFPCPAIGRALAALARQPAPSAGPWTRDERLVAAVFVATAAFWVSRGDVDLGAVHVAGWASRLGLERFASDSTVALFCAALLFALPSQHRGKRLLDWEIESKVPWGVLLLFGGGFALAGSFQDSGLSPWLGDRLVAVLPAAPAGAAALVALVITFLTEVTSNTATASVFVPLARGMADAAGQPELLLMLPTTIAASCAFMLPVATPPNAIVFGSGRVGMGQMIRAGLILNLLGTVLITLFAVTWWRWVLG